MAAQNGWNTPLPATAPNPTGAPTSPAASSPAQPAPPAAASGWGKPPASDASGWGAPPPTTPLSAISVAAPSGWGTPAAVSAGWTSPPPKPTGGVIPPSPTRNSVNGARVPTLPRNGATPKPEDKDVEALAKKVDVLSTEEAEVEDFPKKSGSLIESSQVVEVKLADLAADANGLLYSGVSTFEDLHLHPDLLKGIYGMGFQRPSKIQERALPLLVANPPKNMIGQSQSGTGKTAAFVLTMLSRIDFNLNYPQCVCLAPARELARQIMDVVKEMGKYTAVTTAFAIKDSTKRGEKITSQIIVGTPGTVLEAIRRRDLDVSKVRIFVMDEADNMLDQQALGDHSIRVKNTMPKTCQIVLFSATFPPAVKEFAAKFAPNANMISLRKEELSVDGIKQFYMDCRNEEHKKEVLCALYGLLTIGQSIIFCRRRDVADRLGEALTSQGHVCIVLHGGYTPEERDKAIDDFRDGRCKVLITTNVIARGIDILQVNLVVNFDIPLDGANRPDPETYLHRIGRTGRFGRTGVSINFVHDEQSYREMKHIEDHFQREITRVPTENYMEVEKILKKAVK